MEMQLVLIVSLVSCYCTKYVIGVTTQSSENAVVKVKNLIAEVTVMKNNYQELLKRVRNIEIEIVDLTNQEKYWKNELENIKRYMACQIEELNDINTENNDKLNETKAALMKTMISFSQSLTLMNQTIQELSHSRPETLRCEGNLTECSFTSVTPCNSSPCVNSGSCLTVNGSNLCFCPEGYSGKLCEVDPCDSLPCGNGGTKTLLGTTCQCSCRSGFSGLLCEVTPCTTNPCRNAGTCFNVDETFACVCQSGYSGKQCEVDVCSRLTCRNGGTKSKTGSTCRCRCGSGYSGSYCEVTPCMSSPCVNGGTCTATSNGRFSCRCPPGTGGTRCERTPCYYKSCSYGPCVHNGLTAWCLCPGGYNLDICKIRIVGSKKRGRLEVYYNSRWGTVCDDAFEANDAKVACFNLGFSRAGTFYTAGSGSGTIFLDDLACKGYESSLRSCTHRGWGSHNCAHSEDVGIQCY